MKNQKIVIIFGLPGAGKGYLSEALLKTSKFLHCSPGNIMRTIIANPKSVNDYLMQKAIWKGVLVSSKMVKDLMMQEVSKQNKKIIILDGYPRDKQQVDDLNDICKQLNAKISAVVYLKIDEKLARERLENRLICPNCQANYNKLTAKPQKEKYCDKCQTLLEQRKDDKHINIRFDVFSKMTMPIILKYAKESFFFNIEASQLNGQVFFISQKIIAECK